MSDKLIKPTFIVFEPCYDFFDVMHYLEKKYNFDMHDYGKRAEYHFKCVNAGDAICGDNSWYVTKPNEYTELQQKAHDVYTELKKSEPEYQNFWHLYCDDINGNDSFFYMYIGGDDDSEDDDSDDDYPDWAKEILTLIRKEFASEEDEYIKFYVSW